MKNIKYHISNSFIDNEGKQHTFVTQLYKTGVYGIFDNDPSLQGNFKPQQIKKMEIKLNKMLNDKKIKSFELGYPITVSDDSGFWKKVES